MDFEGQQMYPELAASGGLEAALKEAARLQDRELGPLWPGLDADIVRMETARGVLAVDLAPSERRFRISVYIPESTWPIGSTDNIGLLVEALAAWREGVPFDELRDAFEFLQLDEFIEMLESGEPTKSQWSNLFASEFYSDQWGILRCIHADGMLRGFFPTVTHDAVRLRVNPLDGSSRQVLVRERNDGNYEVLRVGAAGEAWDEVAPADLTGYLRRNLVGFDPNQGASP